MKIIIGKYIVEVHDGDIADGQGEYHYVSYYDGHKIFANIEATWQDVEVEIGRIAYKAWCDIKDHAGQK